MHDAFKNKEVLSFDASLKRKRKKNYWKCVYQFLNSRVSLILHYGRLRHISSQPKAENLAQMQGPNPHNHHFRSLPCFNFIIKTNNTYGNAQSLKHRSVPNKLPGVSPFALPSSNRCFPSWFSVLHSAAAVRLFIIQMLLRARVDYCTLQVDIKKERCQLPEYMAFFSNVHQCFSN